MKSPSSSSQYNVASFNAKQPREKAEKSCPDYLALEQKARWFEIRRPSHTWQAFMRKTSQSELNVIPDAENREKFKINV